MRSARFQARGVDQISAQRKAKGTLDDALAARLEALRGWTWNQLDTQWEEAFVRLLAFVESHGHARVTQDYVEGDPPLGRWVAIQRRRHARGRFDPERLARLEALPGWSWTPRDERWEEGFEHLLNYVARHGSADVPRQHIEDDYRLGHWVTKQRHALRRDPIVTVPSVWLPCPVGPGTHTASNGSADSAHSCRSRNARSLPGAAETLAGRRSVRRLGVKSTLCPSERSTDRGAHDALGSRPWLDLASDQRSLGGGLRESPRIRRAGGPRHRSARLRHQRLQAGSIGKDAARVLRQRNARPRPCVPPSRCARLDLGPLQ